MAMATRALLLLILPCFTSAVSVGFLQAGRPAAHCHTPVKTEQCYNAISWALDKGISNHPEWYPDVALEKGTGEKTLAANRMMVQASLHSRGQAECGRPCTRSAGDARSLAAASKETAQFANDLQADEQPIVEEEHGDLKQPVPEEEAPADELPALAKGSQEVRPWWKDSNSEAAAAAAREEYTRLAKMRTDIPKESQTVPEGAVYSNGVFKVKKDITEMTVNEFRRYLNGTWDGWAELSLPPDTPPPPQPQGTENVTLPAELTLPEGAENATNSSEPALPEVIENASATTEAAENATEQSWPEVNENAAASEVAENATAPAELLAQEKKAQEEADIKEAIEAS